MLDSVSVDKSDVAFIPVFIYGSVNGCDSHQKLLQSVINLYLTQDLRFTHTSETGESFPDLATEFLLLPASYR